MNDAAFTEQQRLLWVWSDMKSRCRNPNHRQYADYGGRGIDYCEEWNSLDRFVSDMGPRPNGLMLERVNNSLGYSASNCRWATRQEQNSNRRNCIFVDCDGEQVTLREYCRRKGLVYRPIVKRIQDRNWPIDLALSLPVGSGKVFGKIPERKSK
jgi:hypothetical protein